MIGQSSAFLETLQLAKKTACCDAPVLIEEETGTGKELVARAIHYDSDRKKFPFIPITCRTIPDDLIENELSGHKRAAHSGAQSNNSDFISQAQNGALFLDEVNSLSPDSLSRKVQVTLLKFLQVQVYRPSGGSESCSADVRFMVASNFNFEKLKRQFIALFLCNLVRNDSRPFSSQFFLLN